MTWYNFPLFLFLVLLYYIIIVLNSHFKDRISLFELLSQSPGMVAADFVSPKIALARLLPVSSPQQSHNAPVVNFVSERAAKVNTFLFMAKLFKKNIEKLLRHTSSNLTHFYFINSKNLKLPPALSLKAGAKVDTIF